jgi:alcohol dehydrogenase (NADP+)
MIRTFGFAASHPAARLEPFEFERAAARDDEVEIDVLYCGVCHSDIHQVKNEWSNTIYPCVPGHEIVGRIRRLGANVGRWSLGDLVGVGCMVDSCRSCSACRAGQQNYCEGPNSWLATYNGPMVPARRAPTRANMYGIENTYGGYSNVVVANQDFVLRIPEGLRPEAAASML